MKCTFLIVVACFALIAESHPILGLDAAAGVGQGLGNAIANILTLGLGTVANIGVGALGLGVGVVDAIAKGVGSGLGIPGPAQNAFATVQQGTTQGEIQNDSEKADAYSQESHKKRKTNHHDRARHHTIVTTITRVEKSDEHDVGSNETVEESSHEAGTSKKQASAGIKDYRSNYQGDSQGEEES